MSLFRETKDMEVLDPRIALVIENSVAASRWRIAARFEGPTRRVQFLRLAESRSAAATVILNEIEAAGSGENTGRQSTWRPSSGASRTRT